MNVLRPLIAIALGLITLSTSVDPYPIDGYETSGIRRLLRLQQLVENSVNDPALVPGAMKSIEEINLNLLGINELPEPDPAFTRTINAIFPNLHDSYSIAVLDATPGRAMRYAERKGASIYQPGSVGKIAVAAAFFAEIQRIYPHSFADRQQLMRTKIVRGGKWVLTDSHTVPFYDTETGRFFKRTVQENDSFTLFEWLDHMLSVSNNGAASVVWREAVLMRAFGNNYIGLTQEQADEYFRSTPKAELSNIANNVVNEPLRQLDIEPDEWRLGTFFTRGASSIIPGKGGSAGSARGLMKFLVRMESGTVVDQESSLELKRLLYMTDRRIRYAASPSLKTAAVYFKSGSLYSCAEEEGYTCGKYMGNKSNYMNSVSAIEREDGAIYYVVLMSNVLKKNSASDHMNLASRVDREIKAHHVD